MNKTCNICCEDIQESRLVTLKCNPNHIFCYDCISDWYFELLKSKNVIYHEKCTCPICKKFGGYLPLMSPHITKVEYIHHGRLFDSYECYVKGCEETSEKGFTMSHFNILTNKKIPLTVHFCKDHCKNIGRSNIIYTLNDDSKIESKIVYCQCLIGDGKKLCTQKSDFNVTHSNVKYGMCKDHYLLYKNGVELPIYEKDYNIQFSAPVSDSNSITSQTGIITEIEHTICTHKMPSRKFGYCMKPLMVGLCCTKSHNPSTVTDKPVKSVKKKSSVQTTELQQPVQNIQISFGVCNALLKSGTGNCQNKGKPEYGNKCGKHKTTI